MATSNVVKLPTAANRKVKQPCVSRKYLRAVAELVRHPAQYMTAPQRRADKQAAELLKMGHSAELVLSTAIFQTLSSEQQTMVRLHCAMAAETVDGRQAIAWLDYVAGDYGTQSLIKSSLRRLAEQGL